MDNEQSLSYYRLVKERIGHSADLCSAFQDIMRNDKRINPCLVLHCIADLFKDYPDLVEGFEIFLPDCLKKSLRKIHQSVKKSRDHSSSSKHANSNNGGLLYQAIGDGFMDKVSITKALKRGAYSELKYFYKVKQALEYKEVFTNFMHCFSLFNDDHITSKELVKSVSSFLRRFPELLEELEDILRLKDPDEVGEPPSISPEMVHAPTLSEEEALDIDYCAGKQKCASYRPLPKDRVIAKCSGQTELCKEVLNETWAAFSSWASSKVPIKTKYEETMYRIEDERYELDMAIQTNAYIIEVLTNVLKSLYKMSEEEKRNFVLDDALGGTSTILNYRFLHRIYGDRTKELLDGLQENPLVAIPVVLNRLRYRGAEWKDVQEKYNVIWCNQINRIYLRSLDCHGPTFKARDLKYIQPNVLLNEIETHYQEKKKILSEGKDEHLLKPHIMCSFSVLSVFNDACNLIIQDIKRHPVTHKGKRHQMLGLLCGFIRGFFNINLDTMQSCAVKMDNGLVKFNFENSEYDIKSQIPVFDGNHCSKKNSRQSADATNDDKTIQFWMGGDNSYPYSLFFVNNNWYILLRLFSLLVSRLTALYVQSLSIECSQNEKLNGKTGEKSSAYTIFLRVVGELLAGKLDTTRYEDKVRKLFGAQGYFSYTIGKVISGIVKQLHLLISDDLAKQCMSFHIAHTFALRKVNSPWLLDDIENRYEGIILGIAKNKSCYKVVWCKNTKLLAIELLDPRKHTDHVPSTNVYNYLGRYLKMNSNQNFPLLSAHYLPVMKQSVLMKQYCFWTRKSQEKFSEKHLSGSLNSTTSTTGKKNLKRYGEPIFPDGSKQLKTFYDDNNSRESHGFPVSERPTEIHICDTKSASSLNENFVMDVDSDCLTNDTKVSKPVFTVGGNKNINPDEMVDMKVASDTDKDSINIYAKDLLLHLAETGMPVSRHVFESRTSDCWLDPLVYNHGSPEVKLGEADSGHSKNSINDSANIYYSDNGNNDDCESEEDMSSTDVKKTVLYDNTDSNNAYECVEDDNSGNGDFDRDAENGYIYMHQSFYNSGKPIVNRNFLQYEDYFPVYFKMLEIATQDLIVLGNVVPTVDEITTKVRFAKNSEEVMYRKGSMSKAKKNHRDVTIQKNAKFKAWHSMWMQQNITMGKLRSCHDWFLQDDHEGHAVECIIVNDQNMPPYGPYVKYHVNF